MVTSSSSLKFNKDFDPNTGIVVKVAPNIVRVTAPNASAFTFTGTNSYILGADNLVLIDPGPDDSNHLLALLEAIDGRKLSAILLTHTHIDHSRLALKLAKQTGAPIYFGGKHRLSRKKRLFEINHLKNACDWDLVPDKILYDGEKLRFGDFEIKAIATPGHCANHFSFALIDSPYVFTGDHIMGWNSTLIATPDGSLGDYFASLDKIITSDWQTYLPAHGGEIKEGGLHAKALKTHRKKRNSQILQALKNKYLTINELVNIIYPQHKGRTRFAARLTLKAHLEYLLDKGEIVSSLSLKGWKYDSNF
ncbi:MAG: MBL fold metallo-hydrolase [Devosiaceae bacterium]|nr:MBL fold metallo-hydrolase [Devosiaceae bacterium]